MKVDLCITDDALGQLSVKVPDLLVIEVACFNVVGEEKVGRRS